jgi:ribosomal-protein-alanine acetyltransferase
MMNLEVETPGGAHWSSEHYESLFSAPENPERFERFAWVIESDSANQGTEVPVALLALLVAQKLDAEWELENIVVAVAVRRRGLGTLLLAELIKQVRANNGGGIFLEVRESNQTARALYQKAGFKQVGSRNSYYAHPVENAMLYRLIIA